MHSKTDMAQSSAEALRYPWENHPGHDQVVEVMPGVLWVRLKLPFRLNHVNIYLLADGDEGSNNGNWQWITSIEVDPAPYFRRMYNPATQQ